MKGGPPLDLAASKGVLKIVELLIDRGADIDLKEGYAGSALQAAGGGHKLIVDLLVKRGASIDMPGHLYAHAMDVAKGSKLMTKALSDGLMNRQLNKSVA